MSALHVVVVGGGIGGFAAAVAAARAGHRVTVLEATAILEEIGAGIEIASAASRLLTRWECTKPLLDKVVYPKKTRFIRWKDGATLTESSFTEIYERYKSPYWTVHRADLHLSLMNRAEELGVKIRVNARVVEADIKKASVTLYTGEVIGCDFIIGADGIHSRMRDILFGKPVPAQPTGDYAYRFILNTHEMAADPLLAGFVKEPIVILYWGPGRHIVGYPLKNGKIFNLVFFFPDDGTLNEEEGKKAYAEVEEVMRNFEGWAPE